MFTKIVRFKEHGKFGIREPGLIGFYYLCEIKPRRDYLWCYRNTTRSCLFDTPEDAEAAYNRYMQWKNRDRSAEVIRKPKENWKIEN